MEGTLSAAGSGSTLREQEIHRALISSLPISLEVCRGPRIGIGGSLRTLCSEPDYEDALAPVKIPGLGTIFL